MKKILWQSQHPPLPKQLAELRRLFGEDAVVEQNPRPFGSAEEIKRRLEEGHYDEFVVVAPLSVVARLCELNLRPLWAEMQQLSSREGSDLSYRGRFYRFIRFRRIMAVKLEFFEELE